MSTTTIKPSTLDFLKTLELNNNREWFNENKTTYLEAHDNVVDFVADLIVLMNTHDAIENQSAKKSMYRIYNDVRFSKSKLPYKSRFTFKLQRATSSKRGGYYMSIQPGNSYLACGFSSPNSADLKRIRKDIEINADEWRLLLKDKSLLKNFKGMAGEQVLTYPRGFDKDHEAIDLLRYKQFIFRHNFTDEEVLAAGFVEKVDKVYKSVRPIFDYLSNVLTTDLNGESTI